MSFIFLESLSQSLIINQVLLLLSGFSFIFFLTLFFFIFLLFPTFVIIICIIHNVLHSNREFFFKNLRLKDYLNLNNEHVIEHLHTIYYMLHKLKRHIDISNEKKIALIKIKTFKIFIPKKIWKPSKPDFEKKNSSSLLIFDNRHSSV